MFKIAAEAGKFGISFAGTAVQAMLDARVEDLDETLALDQFRCCETARYKVVSQSELFCSSATPRCLGRGCAFVLVFAFLSANCLRSDAASPVLKANSPAKAHTFLAGDEDFRASPQADAVPHQ